MKSHDTHFAPTLKNNKQLGEERMFAIAQFRYSLFCGFSNTLAFLSKYFLAVVQLSITLRNNSLRVLLTSPKGLEKNAAVIPNIYTIISRFVRHWVQNEALQKLNKKGTHIILACLSQLRYTKFLLSFIFISRNSKVNLLS